VDACRPKGQRRRLLADQFVLVDRPRGPRQQVDQVVWFDTVTGDQAFGGSRIESTIPICTRITSSAYQKWSTKNYLFSRNVHLSNEAIRRFQYD
jgi:hypothetical protein